MNKDAIKRRDEAIRVLAEAYPHLTQVEVVRLQNRIFRIARRLSQAECEACNNQAGTNALPKEQERAETALVKLLKEYRIDSKYEMCTDARGFAVKLYLPTGKSNSFAGEVWGW